MFYNSIKQLYYESQRQSDRCNRWWERHWQGTGAFPVTQRKPGCCPGHQPGGFIPIPGQSIYGATKAAIKLLTEGLNSELADTNVDVSIVFPGAIRTNIMSNSGLEMPKADAEQEKKFNPMDPGKAADMIIDGMEKKEERIFVGKDSRMLNLLYRLSPGFASHLVAKKMKSLLP